MNMCFHIKELTFVSNLYLPGVGLVRTSRNPLLNEQLYFEAVKKRNKKCHFYQLLFVTDLLKKTFIKKIKFNNDVRLLNCILPEDLSITILSYLDDNSEDGIPCEYIDYKPLIYHNNNYMNRMKNKWYITISNILYLFQEEYHREILYLSTIHKDVLKYNYSEHDYNLEFIEFYNLLVESSLKTTKEKLYDIIKSHIYHILSL